MKKIIRLLGITISLLVLVTTMFSCEKGIPEEDDAAEVSKTSKNGVTNKGEGNVTIRISDFKILPFDQGETRAATNLATYCSRLVFAVYQNGKKVEGLSQMKEDGGFGEVTMKLEPGTYKLLVLAHSSVGGNPTVSNPESIQFTNALCYSDTFSFYGNIEVTGEAKTYDITLNRNVSCLRFTIQDDFPEDVKCIKFYYTGGSGVLNAVTGFGANVNSKQEKTVTVSSLSTPLTFNLFTFLQEETGVLQLKVTAYKEDKTTVVLERSFKDIPMKHQCVTEYTGYFFSSESGFSLTAETDWGDPYYEYTY